MTRFQNLLSSLVFLSLSAPMLVSAQPTSNLTDAQVAENFSPVKCQISKGTVDMSTPVDQDSKRYASLTVTGEPGLVMLAEFVNISGGMRTGDLSPRLSSVPAAFTVSTTLRSRDFGFMPRLSWRFSEKYRILSLELSPDRIPNDYEVMIVLARPSTVLSESQVKKFAFSDPVEYSSHQNSILAKIAVNPQFLGDLVGNRSSFLENSPIHRINMKSLCDRAMVK
jgi:hypothetical protein